MSISERAAHVFSLRDCNPGDPNVLTCAVCDRDLEPRLIEHPQVVSGFVGQGRPLYVAFCGECVEREALEPGQAVPDQRRAAMHFRYEQLQLRSW
jgi:hypothetical protein